MKNIGKIKKWKISLKKIIVVKNSGDNFFIKETQEEELRKNRVKNRNFPHGFSFDF